MKALLPVRKKNRMPGQFEKLADVPSEIEWLANITNEKTRRAYKIDVSEFSEFLGLTKTGRIQNGHTVAFDCRLTGNSGRP